MANTIQIKHGSTAPGSALAVNELGYCTSSTTGVGGLYIGTGTNTPTLLALPNGAATQTITLASGSWSSGSLSISISALASVPITRPIFVAPSITSETQYKAIARAGINATYNGAGVFTFNAYNATPTIDIPIVITII